MKKIIEYGLYLFAFLLPWQTRWIIKSVEINHAYWEYGTMSLYAVDVILLVILFLWIFLKIYHTRFRHISLGKNKDLLSYSIWGLFAISLASIVFSGDRWLAFFITSRLFFALGLFYLIVDFDYKKNRLIFYLTSGLASSALLAIWQFISQDTFANKWLGLASHQAATLGTSVVEIYKYGSLPERWLRAYGSFDHPNMLGGMMAIGIIILFKILLERHEKERQVKKINLINLLLYFYFIIFSAALFFSFSRTAWLGLVLGLFGFVIFLVKDKNWKGLKVIFGGIGVMIISFLPLWSVYHDLAIARFNIYSRLEQRSIVERVSSSNEAWKIIKESPWGGAGLGNYGLAVKGNEPDEQSWYYQPVHNVFLLIWAETGILGFLLFIGILVSVVTNSLKTNNKFNLALIATISFFMLFDHWLWSLHFGILIFWLLLGLSVRANNSFYDD
ncbi:MAG: O-antigen ligase-related protein [Parcubacteria group bacterium GW2011_GWE2_39_37]|uniref:O-antigen ligase-related protein n=1 Tax=Candidatus Falkowbacteria bacterium GW2011_GWF2_39_8 TaxID=1618642 RepID=A0A0G0SDD5_9BACT|nr:MAG: O-antigen ligase-related protein [Parcubacteria group bacterium GW2011_GWE2_39_37]KKR32715.1 MAG: O-antigen ligase-related protein [Candidatus Falkowbacteria bacterium GW2011_GWF2_39_8]